MKAFLIVVLPLAAAIASSLKPLVVNEPVSIFDEIVERVNSDPSSTWRARVSERFKGYSLESISRLCGSRTQPASQTPPVYRHELTEHDIANIPEEFDARIQWPNCAIIKEVRDQSDCGSCWAMAAVAAASDRVCIATNGTYSPHLSAETVLSCCTMCGEGCVGGYPDSAFGYFFLYGIPTGGNYGDLSGCQAYSMPPCDHGGVNGSYGVCAPTPYDTPSCRNTCDEKSTSPLSFSEDASRNRFGAPYSIGLEVEQIQAEILANGPVVASLDVFADLVHYASGVYKHTTGADLGGHAVKIIGWGVENEVPYWLVTNSWNEEWGDKGLFKIIRGRNHCGIEQRVNAGKFSKAFMKEERSKSLK